MGFKDTAEGWLGSDILFGDMWDAGIETETEKAAKKAREKAAQQARDQLDFDKAVWADNNATVEQLEDDIFGDPVAYAQKLANRRRDAGGVEKTGAKTPSGKKGTFDFGTPTSSEPAKSPVSDAQLKELYDISRYYTEEEFKKRIRSIEELTGAPPISDAEIRNLYDTGRNKSFDDFKGTHDKWSSAAAAANPPDAEVTDYDRERALEYSREHGLEGKLDSSWQNRKDAAEQLYEALNGIQRVDPGEYQDEWNVDANREYVSPEARAAQTEAMDKMRGFTDVKETAEEKLMREIGRRNMERDLRAQREAQASNLRARGAYGSGAELAGFYGAQQELAQRRSLEEMLANANASKRAVDATAKYGEQAFNLGLQDLQQGGLQDINDRFNKGQQMDFKLHKDKVAQEENAAEATREATKYDVANRLEDDKRDDINTVTDTKIRIAGAKTGTNQAGAQPIRTAREGVAGVFRDEAQHLDVKDATNKWGLF